MLSSHSITFFIDSHPEVVGLEGGGAESNEEPPNSPYPVKCPGALNDESIEIHNYIHTPIPQEFRAV